MNNSKRVLSNWIHIPFFNWNVIIVSLKLLGCGFVYRRQNQKGWRFVWSKYAWNSIDQFWSWKACTFKEMFQKWDVEAEIIRDQHFEHSDDEWDYDKASDEYYDRTPDGLRGFTLPV